jgi:AcrR family transcriptional regulator
MTAIPLGHESDPTRKAILAAMNRLLAHKPQRSTGRLNVAQLAIEAGVKRWLLTHQHTDLKDLFQHHVEQQEARRATVLRSAGELESLKTRYGQLLAHSQFLEARIEIYASALNLLAAENAALSDHTAEAAKVRPLPRRPSHMP